MSMAPSLLVSKVVPATTAIAELQQAVKDPRKKVSALHMLGKAFREKGLTDLALGQLSSAAPDCCPTPITQQFLDGRVREKDLFDDIEQFEDYTRWVCNRLIAAAEQDPPRQSEPVVWSQP